MSQEQQNQPKPDLGPVVKFVVGMDVVIAEADFELMLTTAETIEDAELAFFQEINDRFKDSVITPSNIRVMRDDR